MNIFSKIKQIILPAEQRQMIVLCVFLLFGTVLEIMGVGLVIPAIASMTQPDLATSYPQLEPLLNFLGHPSQVQLIAFGMLTLIGFYLLKTLFLTLIVWKQNKFTYGLQASLSARLFRGYLQQSWAFHLRNNSAGLISNVTNEVNVFISMVLQPFVLLLTEGSVLLGIIVLLVLLEPLGTLVSISLFGGAIFAFQRTVRARTLRWGELRQRHDAFRVKNLHQGLGAVKDVKLLGREKDFIAQYGFHNEGSASVNKKQKIVSEVPRLWIELFAVMALGVLVFVMLFQNKPLDVFMPTLGLFAAAAFRIMPSLTRLLSGVQNFRYGLPVLERLPKEISAFQPTPIVSKKVFKPLETALALESIEYQYFGASTKALSQINLLIKRGMSVGFVGSSGAGKSTLVDVILGLLEPTAGQIKVDGVNIQTNLRAWQNQLGYVPQTIYLTDDTLRRNIAFGLPEEEIDDKSVLRAIKAAQLDEFLETLPEGLETSVGERGIRLSGGQRQRIGIARALYHDPAVLVLDEATSALDTATEKAVMEAVNALHGEKTLLIVAHRVSTVANCDWIYRMEKGKIVDEGSFEHVLDINSVSLKKDQENQEIDMIAK